jgi:hypothetical protein
MPVGWPLCGGRTRYFSVSCGSAAPVQLTKLLTYRVHRLSVGTGCLWATALENGRARLAVALWRLYFETGHRRHECLIARMTGSGRPLPASDLARAAAVQRIAGMQYPMAVGSVRAGTERPPRVDRSSERPPLMVYFHRSASGKLSRPLPSLCPAQRISKRGPRCIAWERKNLPSARLNPSIAR